MPGMKHGPLTTMVLAAAIASATHISPASANNLQEEVVVTPRKPVTPREEEILSSAGIKVLRHIAQARSGIAKGDTASAGAQLAKAERLLDIIHAALPATEIKDRIWVSDKDLEYQDTRVVTPDLVPIRISLDELLDIMPARQAEERMEEARGHTARARPRESDETEAVDSMLRYTELDLPVAATRNHVRSAKADLAQGKPQAADSALKAAEQGVVFVAVAIDEPLALAKMSLWQALEDYTKRDFDAARADLDQARVYLEKAAGSTDEKAREFVNTLLVDTESLRNDIEKSEDARTRLQTLWSRTKALAERSEAYVDAGWARYHARSPVKTDLIEARLHLENAGIDLFTGNDPVGAGTELQESERYLDNARTRVEGQTGGTIDKSQVTDVYAGVKSLADDPAAGEKAAYAQLRQKMDTMIESL
jgi:hypothetical protein